MPLAIRQAIGASCIRPLVIIACPVSNPASLSVRKGGLLQVSNVTASITAVHCGIMEMADDKIKSAATIDGMVKTLWIKKSSLEVYLGVIPTEDNILQLLEFSIEGKMLKVS